MADDARRLAAYQDAFLTASQRRVAAV